MAHLPNVRYLTGFTGTSGLLLVKSETAVLVTDARYEEQAAQEIAEEVSVHIRREDSFSALAKLLCDGRGSRRVGFEDRYLTVADRTNLAEACGEVSWEPAGDPVGDLRAVKDAWEIAAIARAAEMADRALSALLPDVGAGMTEREVAARLEYRLRLEGSDPVPFETIVAAGPRTSLPHARPSERPIQEGDLLLIDFGASVDGYASDMTRTVAIGPARDWQRELHASVLRALEAAVGVVRGGETGRVVDAAARRSLEADGLAESFGHGTGHGLGLEVHEAPEISARSDDVLRAGNVVTVEPGVYLPGRGGVRIEEDVVVEAGDCRVLTRFPRELIEI